MGQWPAMGAAGETTKAVRREPLTLRGAVDWLFCVCFASENEWCIKRSTRPLTVCKAVVRLFAWLGVKQQNGICFRADRINQLTRITYPPRRCRSIVMFSSRRCKDRLCCAQKRRIAQTTPKGPTNITCHSAENAAIHTVKLQAILHSIWEPLMLAVYRIGGMHLDWYWGFIFGYHEPFFMNQCCCVTESMREMAQLPVTCASGWSWRLS